MSDLVRAINSIEQKTAEQWNSAENIFEDCPEDLLERFEHDENKFLATPAVIPSKSSSARSYGSFYNSDEYKALPNDERAIYNNSFRLARRVHSHRLSNRTQQGSLFLVVNDNFRAPVLNFNERVGLMSLLDEDLVKDSAKHIPRILREMGISIKEQAQVIESKRRSTKHKLIGVAAVVAIVGGAGYAVYDHIHSGNVEDEQAAATQKSLLERFDAQHVEVPTAGLEVAQIEFVPSMPIFFKEHTDIPKSASGDSLREPRVFTLGSQDCRTFEISNETTLRIVTDAPSEDIYAYRHSNGTAKICNSTPTSSDANNGLISTLDAKVAIEVVDSKG